MTTLFYVDRACKRIKLDTTAVLEAIVIDGFNIGDQSTVRVSMLSFKFYVKREREHKHVMLDTTAILEAIVRNTIEGIKDQPTVSSCLR